MTFKAATLGVVSINQHEILIFGGWNKTQNKVSNILKEYSDGTYSIREGNEMQQPDNFLLNGVRFKPINDSKIIIYGQNHVHEINENLEITLI